MPVFAVVLCRRVLLAASIFIAFLGADSFFRVAAQSGVPAGGWFANSYYVDGQRAWNAEPIAFDRRGGRLITVEDAEKAENSRLTGYGLPDFPRPGQPPMPLWHIALSGLPSTVLCHPNRDGLHDREQAPAAGRRDRRIDDDFGPWLQVGAKVGTWYQGTSMPFSGGIHNHPDNGPLPHPWSFTDTWPRVHPQNVLVDVPQRYGCASLAAAELVRQVTFFGALQSVCDFLLTPVVLRYVSELRCEPDLFDSRTDREGWYDDFSLGDESGGSTVVVAGASYSDSHRFISGSHRFVSGLPNVPCNSRLGCTVESTPHQHPRDYEGPTPWVRRLETALIHMSDVNTVDPATYGLVRRVARIEPLGSSQSSSSEPFPIDAPIGMDEPATGSRAYPPPFYGIPSRSTIEPSAASGGQSGYAYRYGHLLEPEWAPSSLIEHPRAGFDRFIRTAKGPDCLRFLDPLNPVDPCAGGAVDRGSTGLMPSTISRSPASTVRAIDAGGTSAAGGGSSLVSAWEFDGSGLPFTAAEGWSWVVANEATGACVFFHAAFADLSGDALFRADQAQRAAVALEFSLPLLLSVRGHEPVAEALREIYYLRKDEIAWRHIAEARFALSEAMHGGLAAAGYTDYNYMPVLTGGNGLVSRFLGPSGSLPNPLPIATYPPSAFKPSLSVAHTGGPGHNRCYSNFPGYLPQQSGRLAARPSRGNVRAVRIRLAESRSGESLSGVDVPFYDDPELTAGLDASAAAIGLPSFSHFQPAVRSDASRDYATGSIEDVGRTDPPVGAAAYDRFVADRRIEAVDPLGSSTGPDYIGRHPGPDATSTLSCPTFEVGVFDPGARFAAASRVPGSFAGEFATQEMREADSLQIYEDRSDVIGTVNQWCPPGSGMDGSCDPSANPQSSITRITTEVAYTVRQPILDLFGLRYTVADGLDFSPGCTREPWRGRMARFPSWNRCPPFYELADWLVTAELYSGDAPLRSAPLGRGIGPQTAAEWQQVDQADCAAAGLGNDCAWVVRSGYVQWWGDVFNGRDTGEEFQFTGGCFLSPPGAESILRIGEDVGAPSVLQPDAVLICYIREPREQDVVLGCDAAPAAVRRGQ